MSGSNQQMVYTFYINDPDPDSGIWGCIAASEQEAEELCRAQGYSDFFCSQIRHLEPHESPEYADFSLKLNPYLGPQWLPVVDVVEMLTKRLHKTNHWAIQTYALRYQLSPSASPYVQALIAENGGLHLEVSGNLQVEPQLTAAQIEQLEFIGWTAPFSSDPRDLMEEDFPGIPNFYREFEPGWNARMVAVFALESLTSVFGVAEDDYFEFGQTWQPAEIEKMGLLHQLGKHKGDPKGSIFGLKAPEIAASGD